MTHMVIYVPGLGDYRSRGQRFVVRLWSVFGVRTAAYRMRWNKREPFDDKLRGLLAMIDNYHSKGYNVSLVGTSAGASAVLHALAKRKDALHRVVYICGKVQNPETVSEYTYARNPAFRESMHTLADTLKKLGPKERDRVLSIRPLHDGIVPVRDTKLPGVHEKIVPMVTHALSIGVTITFYSAMIMAFIKRR